MPLNPKLSLRLAAAAAVAALALTGCTSASQGGGASSGSTSGPATFDATSVAKDDALAAAVPAALKAKGSISVGMDTSYAPAEFLGGSNGTTPQGYDVDLANAIAATWGMKANVQTAEFSSILPALGSKYDLGISSFTINADRVKAVNLVSYFNAGIMWAVQKGNPKKFDVNDVCGKSIGVQTGTVEEDPLLKDLNTKCTSAGKPAINIVTLKNQTDVTTRLVNGGIDAMTADSPVIRYAIGQTGDSLQTIGTETDAAPEGIAVAKSDTALADLVQKTITKLMADGTYKKILDTWSNSAGALTKSEVNPSTAG
ncbi:MAG: ABC transporter substrate-binding protein [Acidobacteria bacterium]|nr:ABC transporter substrate-binding protein [Acidobacteriota bacterium]